MPQQPLLRDDARLLVAAVLYPVASGTFQAMRVVLVRRGGSPTQVKVPRVVQDTEFQALPRRLRVAS